MQLHLTQTTLSRETNPSFAVGVSVLEQHLHQQPTAAKPWKPRSPHSGKSSLDDQQQIMTAKTIQSGNNDVNRLFLHQAPSRRCRRTPERYPSVTIGPLPTYHPLVSPPFSSSLCCSSWHLPWQILARLPELSLGCSARVGGLTLLTDSPCAAPLQGDSHCITPFSNGLGSQGI